MPLKRALVVLAGGRARRLGGIIKPLLRRPDGATLLEHLVDTIDVDEVVVVAPPAIASHFPGCVEDPGLGPGRALAAVRAEADLWLVAGGDQVSPSADLAERLFRAAREAAACRDQPLFSVFRADALRSEGDPPASLKGWLARLDTAWLDLRPGDAAAFADVDTPEDLARYGLSVAGVPTW